MEQVKPTVAQSTREQTHSLALLSCSRRSAHRQRVHIARLSFGIEAVFLAQTGRNSRNTFRQRRIKSKTHSSPLCVRTCLFFYWCCHCSFVGPQESYSADGSSAERSQNSPVCGWWFPEMCCSKRTQTLCFVSSPLHLPAVGPPRVFSWRSFACTPSGVHADLLQTSSLDSVVA